MTDDDWDLVHRVHMRGIYKTTKAAWPHMLKNKYGRIINTASSVGLYGNFGQANYSAAKLGTVAFSNALALEGRKSNILVNTIAPNAGTRMTATVMPPEMVEALKPEYVATVVGFLCHESSKNTGAVFEVGSGWVSQVRWQRTGGVGFPVNQPLLPEAVQSRFKDITNFDDGRATYPVTTQDSFSAVQQNFENVAAASTAAPSKKVAAATPASGIDVAKAQAADFKPHVFEYTDRDAIIYALGVGAKRTDLDLVYEASPNFVTLPTYGVIPAFACLMQNVPFGDFLPNFNPVKESAKGGFFSLLTTHRPLKMMLLHGEQYLEIKKPIPTSGKLTSKGRIIDILDKGKGATVIVGVTTRNAAGEVVCENEFTNFIRGMGGFGGKKDSDRGAATASNDPPSRAPDAIVREKTSEDQAALYRQSGDLNPLHIDPDMSSMGGFDVPILHGLCTFGIAGKHILKTFCGNDPKRFKSIKVRFAKHVFPGETVETHMWKEGSKIIFQVKVVERNAIAVSNAAVEMVDSARPATSASAASGGAALGVDVPGFASSKIFAGIEAGLSSSPEAAKKQQISKVNAVFQFEVSNKAGKKQTWFVDFKKEGKVGTGAPPSGKPDMTVVVGDDDFVSIANGSLNPQKAFMSGKLKV